MKIGNSIRKAIDDWQAGEQESAMLHACNSIDGTASKVFPTLGSNARFTRLLRDNYDVFGPMGVPGIDLVKTRWPVRVERPKAPGGKPDIADVVYGIHRCSHGHGSGLPDGFDLIPDAKGPARITTLRVENGKVKLSDRVIFGLLAVAVMNPRNVGELVPKGYHLSFGTTILPIDEWWGRRDDFPALAATDPVPLVEMNFAEWMDAY